MPQSSLFLRPDRFRPVQTRETLQNLSSLPGGLHENPRQGDDDEESRNGSPFPGTIVGQVVTEHHLSLETAARAYAAAGIAMADAFISTWETKFTYNLLRPVTYI